ncbi:SCO7613 C-terminal domain-containing membrane protein [Micromonospora sp. NPDC000089]|uniref:SCO7613 C-terminal domain-containing membrane protein n=1 Tax=unclassified Micromonospora TaxID=2617518 RepID=UPI00367C3343
MEISAYPCPGCGAPADLSRGCSGCGRPPYPPAAEVVRLDREIVVLGREVERARAAYQDGSARLLAAQRRRADLATRVRTDFPVPPVPGPTSPARPPVPLAPVGPARVGPGRPEASTRTVQGLLFVLGGLLLGTAAVVFTAVAWATVGVAGRALILAAVTALFLAAPLLATRRGLRGTAETLAAVGLLLVVLDGYAAWAIDLFGVAGWPGSRYAALVAGAGGAVAVGYARLSRLTVPWFAALLLAQPVLPLAVAHSRPDATGWTLTLLGLALADLGVLAALRTRSAAVPVDPRVPSAVAAGQALAWLGFGAAVVGAAGNALVPLLHGRAVGQPLLAGVPLLVVGLVLLAAAWVAGVVALRQVAAGLLVPALAAAVLRPVAELRAGFLPLAAALVAAGLAGGVRALPARFRPGPRIGALVVVGGSFQVAAVTTVLLAGAAAARSLPPWRGAEAGPGLSWGWQLPLGVALAVAGLALLLPRAVRPVTVPAGLALAVAALPAVAATPWPAVLAVELPVGVALLLAVLRPGRRTPTVLAGASAGAALIGHGLLVGLAAPGGTLAALGAVLTAGLAAPVVAGRGDRLPQRIAGFALASALVAAPATVAVALRWAGVPAWWQLRGAFAAAVLLLVALRTLRRARPDLDGYASTALTVALAVLVLVTPLVPTREPFALYAASAALLLAVVDRGAVAGRLVGGISGGLAVLAVAPTVVRALLLPYGEPVGLWSGAPHGVPESAGPATGPALLVLAVAAAVATRGGRRASALAALPFGAAALPVLLVAVRAPWPTVPAAVLLTGIAALLLAALTRAEPTAPAPDMPALPRPAAPTTPASDGAAVDGPAPAGPVRANAGRAGFPVDLVAVPVGLVWTGCGLAGLLATRAATLAGLAVLVVAAAVAGVAGRRAMARLLGWLTAVAAGTCFAVTASLAAGLPLRAAGFAVLAVAVLVLFAAPLPERDRSGPIAEAPAPAGDDRLVTAAVPRRAVRERATAGGSGYAVPARAALEVAAQAVAGLALLLTLGSARHAAAVCVLWGAAVALRVPRRGESTAARWWLAGIAGGSELAGAWLLLAAGEVALLEAYTLPAAGLALAAGLVALRTRPGLTSWLALGPGLAAGLLPSLASVLGAPEPQPWRRLLLGGAALAVVLVGAVRRWRAPVLLGGATLALLALHEVARGWDLLPRWIYLAAGGVALIALAATYERRRRDLTRLRAALHRMG